MDQGRIVPIGLDPSFSNFGISDGIRSERISTSAKDSARDRATEIVHSVSVFIHEHQAKYETVILVIEGPIFFGSDASAVWDAGYLMARLDQLAMINRVDVLVVNPTQLKKFVCGKGNAPKTEVALDILQRWNVRFTDDRGADKAHAFALHKYGLAYLDGSLEHVPAKKRGRVKKLPPLRFQDVPADAYAWICGGGAAQTLEVPGRAPLTLDKVPAAWRKRAARVLQAGMA